MTHIIKGKCKSCGAYTARLYTMDDPNGIRRTTRICVECDDAYHVGIKLVNGKRPVWVFVKREDRSDERQLILT